MKRIGFHSPNPLDQCALYRSSGPLGRLAKERKIELIEFPEVNWACLNQIDILFLSRPSTIDHVEWVEAAVLMGVPVWVDFDDNLFFVPWDNEESLKYNNKNCQTRIAHIARLANVITVSSEHLLEVFSEHNKNIVLIPNANDEEMFPYLKTLPERNKNLITWRGSPTHTADLMEIKDPLIEFMLAHKEAKLKFYGFVPWMLFPELNDRVEYRCLEKIFFFHDLYISAPLIHIAPLRDNTFNRAKSNIAFLEAARCGASVIASDLPEFQRPGVITCKTKDDWAGALWRLYNEPGLAIQNARHSIEYIRDELSLKTMNEKRMKIVSELGG